MLWAVPLAPILAAGVAALVRRAPGVAGAGVGLSLAGGLFAASGEWAARWGWGPALELSLSADGVARLMVVLVPVVAGG